MNPIRIRRRAQTLACFVALLGASTVQASAPVAVTTGADSGPGSLREALTSGAEVISIQPSVARIELESSLVYTGTSPLALRGLGQTIAPAVSGADFTLLEITQGANLTVDNLDFQGSGGFSLDNPGTGKGIFVAVPIDRTGVVRVELSNVRVSDVANHGIHLSDCTLGDDCGGGSGGGGAGSPASIHAVLKRVLVDGAGTGKFDADGLRIDERADGDILLQADVSRFVDVGADGIELDEGNDGSVWIDIRNVSLEDNGAYCVDAPLVLDESNPCVEDDDGELVLDLDDGFDIDEAGAGSIEGRISDVLVVDNLDEGLDFDEEDDGGIKLQIDRVLGSDNGDEAIKLSAAGSGNVQADLRNVSVVGSGNDGIEIENEDGDGQLHVSALNVVSLDNDGDGLQMAQENESVRGTLKIRGNSQIESLDLENVDEI